jgi:dienelactone hydrolase
MPLFSEPQDAGNAHRAQSIEQLNQLIKERKQEADTSRVRFFAPRVDSIQHYEVDTARLRRDFAQMLGWPLVETPPPPQRRVLTTLVGEDEASKIYRLRIPAIGPLDLYGVLFVPPGPGPFPLIIAQHGGQGTPELASELSVDSSNYHDMARRPVQRGAMVFAPQLFLNWQKEWGPGRDQFDLDKDLKQLGGSRAALELLMLRRALDHLLTRPDVDTKRVGMIGLSYGGFYTLAFAALDTRIKVALSSCFFNDRYRYNWSDWVWTGSALKFFDAEIASLVCPRPLFLEIGENDELFTPDLVATELAKVEARYKALNIGERLGFKKHLYGHAFDPANDGLDFVFRHLVS